jgi:FkbM family methyltransferase
MIEESWLVDYVLKAKAGGAKTAIDVGANVGEFSRLLAEHFDHVVAVEPDPRAFAILEKSVPSNVVCLRGAVAAGGGDIDFHLRPHTVQSSLLLTHPIGAGDQADAPVIETIRTPCLSLDEVLALARFQWGDVGRLFCKVDVEGAEGQVLAGAFDAAYRVAAWLIEIHDREREVEAALALLGFDEVEVIPHPYPSAHPKHMWFYANRGDE